MWRLPVKASLGGELMIKDPLCFAGAVHRPKPESRLQGEKTLKVGGEVSKERDLRATKLAGRNHHARLQRVKGERTVEVAQSPIDTTSG